MTAVRVTVAAVLGIFIAATVHAVAQVGYVGFFEAANANAATRLMMLDLVICLTLIAVWMVRDVKERGGATLAALPYLAVGLFFGAAGPLLYLLRRPVTSKS
jgi:uncharacterized membrane protein YadS